ncbi:MAG: IS30 family transposase [Pseudomonadales bacterium]
MTRLGRPGLSASQRAELWERWKQGESLTEIGDAIGKHAGSVFGVLRTGGGIYSPPRSRAITQLSLSEREEISRGVSAGCSMRAIARHINRAPSTVSREIERNGGIRRYRASEAEEATWNRGSRPKRCKLAHNIKLQRIVARKLSFEWSPEQISGWLKLRYPMKAGMHVSHETIYRSLFVQTRGVLKKELMKHLRSRRVMRHGKRYSTKGKPRGRIIDAISIRERPPEVEDRAVPGHWEGDLISGSGNTHIATLVERQSRFTLLVKVEGKDTNSVVSALIRQIKKLPDELLKTITWDRGSEMAQHKKISVATDVVVYFCDPQSPWQRGTNENTNRLLRQYLPKQTDLSVHTQSDLNAIARRLNQRPRKRLAYQTPADKLQESVAATS